MPFHYGTAQQFENLTNGSHFLKYGFQMVGTKAIAQPLMFKSFNRHYHVKKSEIIKTTPYITHRKVSQSYSYFRIYFEALRFKIPLIIDWLKHLGSLLNFSSRK